jgi:hypothetical protein
MGVLDIAGSTGGSCIFGVDMSDITLLGLVAAGLGMYCLYLQIRVKMLNDAGKFMTELLIKTVREHTNKSEREAAEEVRRMAIAHAKHVVTKH